MIITDRSVILHIPRTGGQFIYSIIRDLGINANDGYPPNKPGFSCHININELIDDYGFNIEDINNKYIIVFIRNPITRLQSIWSYFKTKSMYLEFNDFVREVLISKKDLMITDYKKFVLDSRLSINFIGRYEYFIDDLILGLENAGECFDKQIILNNYGNKRNNSGSWKEKAIYEPELLKKLLELEKPIMEEFYSGVDWKYG